VSSLAGKTILTTRIFQVVVRSSQVVCYPWRLFVGLPLGADDSLFGKLFYHTEPYYEAAPAPHTPDNAAAHWGPWELASPLVRVWVRALARPLARGGARACKQLPG
jgi:hypothetical protein